MKTTSRWLTADVKSGIQGPAQDMSSWKLQRRKNESVAAMTEQKSLIEDLRELVRTSSKENEKLRGQVDTLQRELDARREDIDYYLHTLSQTKKKLRKETLKNRKLKAQLGATASVDPQPLSYWCDESGLQAKEIARLAGLTYQTLYTVKNLGSLPSMDTAFKLCGVLGVGLADVAWGEKKEAKK